MKIRAGIIGATGYAGGELARLLLQREDMEITWFGSRSYVGQDYASVYQNMYQMTDGVCQYRRFKPGGKGSGCDLYGHAPGIFVLRD